MKTFRCAVLGGAGAMGRAAVRDLFETSAAEILVADCDGEAATRLASSFASPRVRAERVDVTDVGGTARILEGSFALINAVQYQLNLQVMEAALAAGAHYVDLGGLFHMTRRQLELHPRFQAAGLLALLGMGGAPGTTNLLARWAADSLDEVREIHVRVASAEAESTSGALDVGYSIQTILEEAARPAAVVRGGRLEFVEAMAPAEEADYPPPIGRRRPAMTIHSEVATLPETYPGLQECSFAIDFGRELTDRLRFLQHLGVNSLEPVRVAGQEVVPHQVLLAVLRRRPRAPEAAASAPPEARCAVLRAVARGVSGGRSVERVADCHVRGMPEWGLGLETDTGCPPSIAVQMLARGEIETRGALPPERAVPLEPFFQELCRRRMTVELR